MNLMRKLAFWRKPEGPQELPVVVHYKKLQEITTQLHDLEWWFSNEKEWKTEEIMTQFENATSRAIALRDAVLIRLRQEQEKNAAERINRHIKEHREAVTEGGAAVEVRAATEA